MQNREILKKVCIMHNRQVIKKDMYYAGDIDVLCRICIYFRQEICVFYVGDRYVLCSIYMCYKK